jgi:hypothetical protein
MRKKSRKVIITCAPTDAIHTPSMSVHLLVTVQKIAQAADAAQALAVISIWGAASMRRAQWSISKAKGILPYDTAKTL